MHRHDAHQYLFATILHNKWITDITPASVCSLDRVHSTKLILIVDEEESRADRCAADSVIASFQEVSCTAVDGLITETHEKSFLILEWKTNWRCKLWWQCNGMEISLWNDGSHQTKNGNVVCACLKVELWMRSSRRDDCKSTE